ncbi:hypothetical protein QQS21_006111 [Conoideocrella luteorostrata]|uniref:CHAT domain-containing protein n=1 Tax=Conoideocrella luteorostrata TaxID=1105319 RepID=A0AAJ0CR42_9HYPO|nr:hypothetical protein QQS21_006111 [Conoideocrella luteorostrata]
MQDTPHMSNPLPSAPEEVSAVRSFCGSMQIVSVEPRQTKKEVTEHLKNCRLFHFAGHGFTDNTDPSRSLLALRDWRKDPLTVRTLLDMNLHKYMPFLAYLSACGTGQIHEQKFVDESLHLISACQLAGFRHVIGTLWEMDDATCVDVAKHTYGIMGARGITDRTVCLGLHHAARELRDRWVAAGKPPLARKWESGEDDKVVDNDFNATRKQRGGSPTGIGQRDVQICDEDEEGNSQRPANWVPYVHFGV